MFTLVKRLTLITAIVALATGGSALAAGVTFDDAAFDPFEDEEGYVDIVRDGDLLTVTLSTDEGSIPASMTSDFLPLDDDEFDEELLERKDALARFAGLPFATTRTTVMVVVDGDPRAIMRAVLDRLAAQGIVYVEDFPGGPVHSYLLAAGDARWRIAMSVTPEGTILHLQAFVHTAP